MNIQNTMRELIINEIFNYYDSGWAVLVYDKETANIINPLFTRSEIIKYHIMFIKYINEESETWDFPVIYFVNCDAENSAIINKEFKEKKYSEFRVCSISEPVNLDNKIKYKIIHTPINAIEERIFLLKPENLYGLQIGLKSNIRIKYYSTNAMEMAQKLDKQIKELEENHVIEKYNDDVTFLLINRDYDSITPLVHFFTFRSAIKELENKVDCKDILYPELRNNHIAEVQEILRSYAIKLKKAFENVKQSQEIDMNELSKLIIDAPKNIKIKEAVQKYSKIMQEMFDNVNNLKELIEAEQILTTEYDACGQKKKKSMEYYLDILENTKFSKEDRIRFLYLLKIKGLSFSNHEKKVLKNIGFDEEDISIEIDTSNQIFRKKNIKSKYKISRYVPILYDILCKYSAGEKIFENVGEIPKKFYSLRKTSMLSSKSAIMKPVVIVYILGGITEEECAFAYILSNSLGMELLIGSDKMLIPEDFIKILKDKV